MGEGQPVPGAPGITMAPRRENTGQMGQRGLGPGSPDSWGIRRRRVSALRALGAADTDPAKEAGGQQDAQAWWEFQNKQSEPGFLTHAGHRLLLKTLYNRRMPTNVREH